MLETARGLEMHAGNVFKKKALNICSIEQENKDIGFVQGINRISD